MTDRLRPGRAIAENFDQDIDEQESGVRARSSGVRVKAPAADVLFLDDESEAPTIPPPRAVERDRTEALAPIHELLYRFDVGDHRGALAAAESLLDRSLIPAIVVAPELLSRMGLDTAPSLLLSCIDGHTSLEAVLDHTGLPMLDALRALCDLLDAKVVTLRI